MSRITTVALVVPDYDEAIAYYTGCLGFRLIDDRVVGPGKRWVLVAPSDAGGGAGGGAALLLAKASNSLQESRIGDQTGGRVFLFLETDDFDRDYAAFRTKGVRFLEEPRSEQYGRVVVFVDRYGNRWDLVGRKRGDEGGKQ